MTVIVLTGSIGSGKSTVSKYLIKKGYRVIDSDELSRAVVKKGGLALKELVKEFGEGILDSEKNLDRKKLGSIVFKNPTKKARLEEIVTARIIKEIKKELSLYKKKGEENVVFVDAPIFFESKANIKADFVWLVVADDKVRASRVMERDGCSFAEFKRRSNSQIPQKEKILLADRVIDNSGSTNKLYTHLRKLLKELDV